MANNYRLGLNQISLNLFFVFAACIALPFISASWDLYRLDELHTADCDECSLKYNTSDDVKINWQIRGAPGNASAIIVSTINMLFWGDDFGKFYGVAYNNDKDNYYHPKLERNIPPGYTIVWTRTYSSPIFATPAYYDNTVTIATAKGELINVVAFTGEELWRWSFNTSFISSPTTIATTLSNWIYIGTMDGQILGITTYPERRVQWTLRTNGSIVSTPAVLGPSPHTIVVGSTDGCIYTLNGLKGNKLWQYCTQSPIVASPVIFGFPEPTKPTIVIGNLEGNLYSLQLKTGELNWIVTGGGAWRSSAGYEGEAQIIYVGNDDGKLYSVAVNGTITWTFPTGGPVVSSPATVDTENTVIFSSSDGYVYALGVYSDLVWQFKTGIPGVTSAVAVGVDGTVYVGTMDGLIAI